MVIFTISIKYTRMYMKAFKNQFGNCFHELLKLIISLTIVGVFGAGKSFLLSVIVLFLVKVFQRNDLASPRELFPWKLLISSTTNVAVDRILQG